MHPLADLEWETGVYYLPVGTVGTPHLKPLVWFPSGGCIWSLKGGCTMCDFGATTRPLNEADVLHAFEQLLRGMGTGARRIHIGPGGSFFTDEEVPPNIRVEVIRRLSQMPFLQGLGIETRPPFLTAPKLDDVIRVLPGGVRNVTLGFGLECVSDLPRLVGVNKGYGVADVERAITILQGVGADHPDVTIGFEIYVLLKPLLLKESEAIEEALATIDWAFRSGAETVVLFLNTVKENTIQGLLNSERVPAAYRYEPPYLRSAIEVLRQLPDNQRRRTLALGPTSAVPARGMPRGCALCSWPLNGALIAHNLYRDSQILHDAAASVCPCKVNWEDELDWPSESAQDRAKEILGFLERETGLSEGEAALATLTQ